MEIDIQNKKNVSGPYVKIARLHNNLTQSQLSAKLKTLNAHIDRASISKIESQKRIVTDLELLSFSKALDTSIYKLLGQE